MVLVLDAFLLNYLYVGNFRSHCKYLFTWKQIQRAQQHYLTEHILSYQTLFCNVAPSLFGLHKHSVSVILPLLN